MKIEEATNVIEQVIDNAGVTVKDAKVILQAWDIVKGHLNKEPVIIRQKELVSNGKSG